LEVAGRIPGKQNMPRAETRGNPRRGSAAAQEPAATVKVMVARQDPCEAVS